MFDVNPNPDGGESALDRGDLFADAAYYRLTRDEAATRYTKMNRPSKITVYSPQFIKCG